MTELYEYPTSGLRGYEPDDINPGCPFFEQCFDRSCGTCTDDERPNCPHNEGCNGRCYGCPYEMGEDYV